MRLLAPDLDGAPLPTLLAGIAHELTQMQRGSDPILMPVDSLRAMLGQRKLVVGGAIMRLVNAGLLEQTSSSGTARAVLASSNGRESLERTSCSSPSQDRLAMRRSRGIERMRPFSVVEADDTRSERMRIMQGWVYKFVCVVKEPQNVVGKRVDHLTNLPVTQEQFDAEDRAAEVCPFVRTSLDRDQFWMAESDLTDADSDAIEALLLGQMEAFLATAPAYDPMGTGQPVPAPVDVIYKTWMTIFPGIPHKRGPMPMFDYLHKKLKPKFMARGMMIGQFYNGCPWEQGAIYAPQFKSIILVADASVRHPLPGDAGQDFQLAPRRGKVGGGRPSGVLPGRLSHIRPVRRAQPSRPTSLPCRSLRARSMSSSTMRLTASGSWASSTYRRASVRCQVTTSAQASRKSRRQMNANSPVISPPAWASRSITGISAAALDSVMPPRYTAAASGANGRAACTLSVRNGWETSEKGLKSWKNGPNNHDAKPYGKASCVYSLGHVDDVQDWQVEFCSRGGSAEMLCGRVIAVARFRSRRAPQGRPASGGPFDLFLQPAPAVFGLGQRRR